ncbi:hypothetical protein KMP13_02385 [Epibacterium ulvae]|uniref:hypothetical protein n=1 Tax=Epibacterium ulvae TaxID=1156985 RepID=UPI001BFC69F9|nr:hypothetical protein [Epibacterium ulvae]MBT8152762.1 hypothetical protein [Epibacterium ulvae]
MPEFRWSIDGGVTWTYEDQTLPYVLPVNVGQYPLVQGIGARVTAGDYIPPPVVPVDTAPSGPEVIAPGASYTLTRGVEPNLLADIAAAGPYTSTGMPRGLSVDPDSGVIEGEPLEFKPFEQATISRGGVDQVVSFGVRPNALFPVPIADAGVNPLRNVDWTSIDRQDLWSTNVTVGDNVDANADQSALVAAYLSAANDQGSVTAPKYHKIVYTGAHIDEATAPNFVRTGIDDPNTVIVVVAQHPTDEYTKVSQVRLRSFPVMVGWHIHGCGNSGAYDTVPVNNYVDVGTDGIHMQAVACRFGSWWLRIDFSVEGQDLKMRSRNNGSYVIEKSEFAGLYGGINTEAANGAILGCNFHNMSEDHFRFFFSDTSATDTLSYIFGNTLSRNTVVYRDDLTVGQSHIDIGSQHDLGSALTPRARALRI